MNCPRGIPVSSPCGGGSRTAPCRLKFPMPAFMAELFFIDSAFLIMYTQIDPVIRCALGGLCGNI